MSNDFVPLSMSSLSRSEGVLASRNKPATGAQTSAPFRPLAGPPAPAPSAPPPGEEPKITLERQGDRVTRITVQCCCGHITELVCNY